MRNLDLRITALEAGSKRRYPLGIRCGLDETPEQACARYGVRPDDPGVIVIRRTIVEPRERAHA